MQEQPNGRKQELLDPEIVQNYVEDLRTVLSQGTLTQRKGFIKSFVKEIGVAKDQAVIRYTIPLPPGSWRRSRLRFCLLFPLVELGGLEPPTSSMPPNL